MSERIARRQSSRHIAITEAITVVAFWAIDVAVVVTTLSMPPMGVGPVKQMVLSCDREAARRGVEALLKATQGSVRNELETLARKLYVAV